MSRQFDVSMKLAKGSFFDRKKVADKVARANRRNLSKAGAFVRRRARSSIRKRKKTSEPGKPPSSHIGHLKRLIFFGFDGKDSVVVGPVPFSHGTAPRALEKGGRSIRRRAIRIRGMKIHTEKTVTIRPRPFMGPALAAEAPNFPDLWSNSVH